MVALPKGDHARLLKASLPSRSHLRRFKPAEEGPLGLECCLAPRRWFQGGMYAIWPYTCEPCTTGSSRRGFHHVRRRTHRHYFAGEPHSIGDLPHEMTPDCCKKCRL